MCLLLGSFPSIGLPCLTLRLFYLIICFCFVLGYYLLEAGSFLMRDRKRVDLDGRGSMEALAGVDGGQTVIRNTV